MPQSNEDEDELGDKISTIENEQEPELPGQSTGHEEEEGEKIYPQNAKTTRKYHQNYPNQFWVPGNCLIYSLTILFL